MAELNVFKLAHQVPIVETIEHYVRLQYRNGKYYGLCPFHDDKTVGSFVVFSDDASSKRGWFQCYSCGVKGDNIDFIRRYLNVGYREAAIIIAENAGIISHSDADALRWQKDAASGIVPVQRKAQNSSAVLAQKLEPEHLNRVYRCFAAASDPLPEKTKEVLLHSRKIPESSLGKYFMFPLRSERSVFWSRFNRNLMKEFELSDLSGIADKLIGVPGFYVGKNNRVTLSLSAERQIGILIFNRNAQISGIQTRASESLDGIVRSEQEKKARYKFFSSGYANGMPGSAGSLGCSCGFVEDVLYPHNRRWNRAVAVTEGRFKAETLASLGFLVVNMHGISNWKSAGKAALELAGAAGAKQFVLCYDREQNNNVFQSASGIYDQLSSVLLTEFAVWDPSLGKGIDDVINAGHIGKVSRISAQEYFKLNKAA